MALPRTMVRQDTQVRNSDLYDDTLPSGVTLETLAEDLQRDLNALRSQMQRVIGTGNWYDEPPTSLASGTALNRIVLTEAGTVVYIGDGDIVLRE